MQYDDIRVGSSELSVQETYIEKIAELAGFSSARVLYKLFKEVEGITISTYRKQNSVFPIM